MRTRTKNPMPPAAPLEGQQRGAVFGGGGLNVAAFLESTKRGRATHQRLSDLDVAIRSAESRAKSGEWHGSTGSVLVGLYAMLHRRVYSVDAAELESQTEMKRASAAARKVLTDSFRNDADAVVEFVKWAWKREQKRAEWARQNGRDRSRLSWRFLFSASMVSDYRVDEHNESVRSRK